MAIRDFTEVRRDGQIVNEAMSVEDIARVGQPEQIVELKWSNGDAAISVLFPEGVPAKVLRDRMHVVALAGGATSVIYCHGHAVRELELGPGCVCWFEPSPSHAPERIGVVVDRGASGMHLLDVDALGGQIVSSQETR